jgi:Flp pilus assembly protein TadG
MKTRVDSIIKVSTSLTSRFKRDERGAMALALGLVAVPFFLAAGIGLDAYRGSAAQANVQKSLDAAALAAAAAEPSATEGQRRKMAQDTFAANIAGKLGGQLNGSADVTFSNGTVTVSYAGTLPTTLMKVGGFNTLNVAGSSTATMRLPQKAEIVLSLDYSGSMTEISAGQVKYETMREAAIDMIENLSEDGKNKEILFGLVPFSHHVYTTLPGAMVVGGGGGTWTGCTQDRPFPHNTTVSAPVASQDNTKWGQPQHPVHASSGCAAYAPNKLIVRPLTDDHKGTINQLKAMKPYAWTHIALGVEFGWHLLDSGAPYAARSESDKTNKKFLVLLTDGKQTEPAFGNGSRTVANGEKNLETLCSNVKASGITVITIAFALNDAGTENRLKGCSTDPDKHFYKAEDSNDLTRAFEEIQNQIASAIYLSK